MIIEIERNFTEYSGSEQENIDKRKTSDSDYIPGDGISDPECGSFHLLYRSSRKYTGDSDRLFRTDGEEIELAAPPIEYSLNPEFERQPYSEYTLNIEAEGFEPVSISGAEILADVTAIQNVEMRPRADLQEPGEVFVIPAHTLYWRITRRKLRRTRSNQ